MDSSAVRRGLANIKSSFARLGGVLRGIGGAMRKSLLPVVGLFAGFGVAAKRVADIGSELTDMSTQTGVSIKEIVRLQEALRLAGVPMRDTSRMLSLMTSNIQEGAVKAGAARDAIQALGLSFPKLTKQSMDRQFMTILERIRDVGHEIPNLEMAMEGIFGARMGFGILRLAKDLDINMERATKNSEAFGQFMAVNGFKLDETADALGRLSMIFQQIVGSILVKLPLGKIADAINSIDTGAVGEFFSSLIDSITAFFANPGQQIKLAMETIAAWFCDFVAARAKEIGEAIGNGIKEALPSFGDFFGGGGKNGEGKGILGGLFGLNSPSPVPEASKIEAKINETNRLLGQIARKEGVRFA